MRRAFKMKKNYHFKGPALAKNCLKPEGVSLKFS